MSQKSVKIRYSDKVLRLTGVDGDKTSLSLAAKDGRVFISHTNHTHIEDKDYQSYLHLTVPEALALYNLLEEFFEK